MHLVRAVLLSTIATVLVVSAVHAAPVPTGDWLELIDVTQLPYLKDGIVTQISSYDRTGGNEDGYDGKYSFVRKEGDKLVLFDEQGPGCIYRIWSANPEKGRIRFYFDGETTPRLDFAQWEDMFQSKQVPFMPPLSQHFLGGWCSYVPIPFAKSCKIVSDGPAFYYQMTWQKFPADRNVKTFSPDLTPEERSKYEQVKAAWSSLGNAPWPVSQTARTQNTAKTVRGGGVLSIADLRGPGIVREVRIKAGNQDARTLRRALLEVHADGVAMPTVWSPLGDFFLDGFAQGISRSLLLGKKDGDYYCYYPMPFASSIVIRIANESRTALPIEAEVVWEPLASPLRDIGLFYAWWHRQNPTVPGQLFPILDAKGRGHWCGVVHAMQGNGGLGFLEGDEMLWMDDRDNTSYNGTGTEDYFDGGWYFGGTGSAPLYGCGVHDDYGSRCLAFRMHLTDYVPFQQKARMGIEHGDQNTVQADYAGVTYWYAEPGTTHGFAPVPAAQRMPQSPRVPHAIEAEDAFVRGVGASIVSDFDLPVTLSAGEAVYVRRGGSVAPPTITLKADAPDSGSYVLEGQLTASPRGGMVQVLVDGRLIGGAIDTRSDKLSVMPLRKLADLPWMRKGSHEITFRMVPEAGESEFMVDCIRLWQTGMIEGERMKILGSSGEDLGEQQLGFPWSNGSQIWFRPSKAGAYFTLELPVRKSGAYMLSACFTKAGDYGIVQVKLDGKPIGQPFDGYHDGVVRSERILLGAVDLSAGNHELTFDVTGKNDKSVSYMVGVDAVELR